MKAALTRGLRINWVMVAIALVGTFQLVFAVTYPLSVGASDNPAYVEMIQTGRSNLILASGYPFIMHVLLAVLQLEAPQAMYESHWLGVIQIAQNVLHFYLLAGLVWLTWRIYGRAVSGWFALLLGCNTLFLAGLNSAAPEWLQGDLIALSLLLAANAFTDDRGKLVKYLLAAGVLTLAYLVKPNSLAVAPCLVALVCFDTGGVARKALRLGLSGLLAGAIVTLFVAVYHLPSTGTRHLNHDHAWILTSSLPPDYFATPVDKLGTNALRWRALVSIVPQGGSRAFAYPTVDTGASPVLRAAYRRRFDDVLKMSRVALQDFALNHPLPRGFQQGVSAIPLYWYVGLEPVDDLGISVYQEAVVERWPEYARRVVDGVATWGAYQVDIVPFKSEPLGLVLEPAGDFGFLRYTVPPGEVPQHMRYWSPTEVIWGPGTMAAERVSVLAMPRPVELSLLLVSIVAMFAMRGRRRQAVTISILAAIMLSSVAGYMLVGVRDKELISMLPTLAILYALGVAWTASRLGTALRDVQQKRSLP